MFKRWFLGAALLAGASICAHADYFDEPEVSTAPIGSSYYRHLARETNIDLRELVKFERRGFGRTEINILIEISTGSLQTLKDYGNRRLKDRVPLKDLVKESHMDWDAVYDQARALKAKIEAMGDNNLPAPVYEVSTSTLTAKENKARKKKEKTAEKDSPIDAKPPAPKPE